MNTVETIETLQRATRALSGICDGARTHDGQGFNGVDTTFGKSLATQSKWSPKQAVAAQKMLRKYTKQLVGFGIDVAELPTLSLDDLMNDKPKTNRIDFNVATQAFEFWFDYEFNQKEYIKNQLKAFYRADERGHYWNLRHDRADLNELSDYIEWYKPEITQAAQRQLVAGVNVPTPANVAESFSAELSKAEDADLTGYDMTGFMVEPYAFQRAGALYGLLKKKVIIGDDMGLGKTIQALLIAHLSGAADKMIVCCPASVKINWQREINRALPAVTTSIWDGKTGDSNVNIIIINYDNLKKRVQELLAWRPRMVVFDELHYLKSLKAARTQAATLLCETEYVVGLTGTPILNRPSELISPLTMLGRIDEFGGWFAFAKRYCQAFTRDIWITLKSGRRVQKKIWDMSGAANLQELNRKLRETCMVRRMKVDVLKDMPVKQRSQVVFPITNRVEYEEAKANLLDYIKACAAEDEAFLATIEHLSPRDRNARIAERQSEAVARVEKAQQLVMIETMKQLAAAGKMDAVIEWVTDFLETGEKLVLFTTHVDAQHKLLKAFPGRCARILGEDSGVVRQAAVDRFRTDSDCKLMVASLAAGGTGIDGLQEVCSNVAFFELAWTPAQHLQAEDRLNRLGQTGQVMCWYLLAENTIEETIQTMLAGKQAVCDSVLDGASEVRTGSIFDELLEVVQGMSGAPDKMKSAKPARSRR